jgi:hypothetical protein
VEDGLVSDDIATQLRWISDTKQWVKLRDWTKITTDAADEIDRLRQIVADLTGESVRLEHEIERLRKENDVLGESLWAITNNETWHKFLAETTNRERGDFGRQW